MFDRFLNKSPLKIILQRLFLIKFLREILKLRTNFKLRTEQILKFFKHRTNIIINYRIFAIFMWEVV